MTQDDFSTTSWLKKLKIIPLKVSELKVGNYYRDILSNRRVRIISADKDGVEYHMPDKDGDVNKELLSFAFAEGRFYDDNRIEQ